MNDLGKMLILGGVVLIAAGALVILLGKVPGAGKIPGDILIKKENFTFYFPVTTSLLVSVVISLILFLWNRK